MADEGDSKSLVLITRVGSTPTTGIKRKPSSLSGGLSFYLRRVSGSNSTTLHSRGAISPAGCCSVRGSQPVGMSINRLCSARKTVRSCCGCDPGGSEQHGPAKRGEQSILSFPVFLPDAVQAICDQSLAVADGGAAGVPDGRGRLPVA